MDKCKYCQYFNKDCVIDYEQSTPNKIIWTEYEKCIKCGYRKYCTTEGVSKRSETDGAENQEIGETKTSNGTETPDYLKIDWSKIKHEHNKNIIDKIDIMPGYYNNGKTINTYYYKCSICGKITKEDKKFIDML